MCDSSNDLPSLPSYLILSLFSICPQRLPALTASPLCPAISSPPRLLGNEMCRGLAETWLLPSVSSKQQMDTTNRGPEQRPIQALGFDELSTKPISRASSMHKQIKSLLSQNTDENGIKAEDPLLPLARATLYRVRLTVTTARRMVKLWPWWLHPYGKSGFTQQLQGEKAVLSLLLFTFTCPFPLPQQEWPNSKFSLRATILS